MNMTKLKAYFISIILAAGILISGCGEENMAAANQISSDVKEFSPDDVPGYTGKPYAVINDNVPFFTEEDISAESFETYSDLDDLGRCGPAFANIGTDLMPTEKRGNIGQVKPSGWQTVKYDFVDGKYLYNRCHLIGFQLTAENANEKNLITGTRYMNVEGMLPFENMTADYIKETKNHVLYRVTPVFTDQNLVASGVLMEARSVEDDGEGILFNVFVYNVQPGVAINYENGESRLSDSETEQKKAAEPGAAEAVSLDTEELEGDNGSENAKENTYILNTNSHKFHQPSCSGVAKMKEENKQSYTGSRDELISQGYSPCGICKP